MLYDLRSALMHSAKGTTWAKHKYIRKVGNRYYYKTDIKAAQMRMKNADDYNNAMKNAKTQEDVDKAKSMYEAGKYGADMYEGVNSKKPLAAQAELWTRNKSAEMLEAIDNGKKTVMRLFDSAGNLLSNKKTKKVDIQAQKQQALDNRVTTKIKFSKADHGMYRAGQKIKSAGNKITDAVGYLTEGKNYEKNKKQRLKNAKSLKLL